MAAHFIFTEADASTDQYMHIALAAKWHTKPEMLILGLAQKKPSILDPMKRTAGIRVPTMAPPNGKTCGACLEKVPNEGLQVMFAPCGHTMHYNCAVSMVESYIGQGKLLPICCPMQNCGGVMDDFSLKLFPTVDKLLKSTQSLIKTAYKSCPYDGCKHIHRSFTDSTEPYIVQCGPGCMKLFCFTCRGRPHKGSCKDARELEDKLVEVERINADKTINLWLAAKYHDAFGIHVRPKWYNIQQSLNASQTGDFTALEPTASFEMPKIAVESGANLWSIDSCLAEAAAILNVTDDSGELVLPPDHNISKVLAAGHPYKFVADPDDMQKRGKFCPKCFVSVIKTDGCPSMRCTMCDHYFCWTCMGPQHTHGTCSQTTNFKALKEAAAGSAGAQAAVKGLVKFSPELELEESAKQAKLRVDKHMDTTYLIARHSRLMPLAQKYWVLDAFVKAGAVKTTLTGLCRELQALITLEYKVEKAIERCLKQSTLRLATEIEFCAERIDRTTITDIKKAAIGCIIDTDVFARFQAIDALIKTKVFNRPVSNGILTGAFRENVEVTLLSNTDPDEKALHRVRPDTSVPLLLPVTGRLGQYYSDIVGCIRANSCPSTTDAIAMNPNNISKYMDKLQAQVVAAKAIMFEELESIRSRIYVPETSTPTSAWKAPRSHRVGDLVSKAFTDYSTDHGVVVNLTCLVTQHVPTGPMDILYASTRSEPHRIMNDDPPVIVMCDNEPVFVEGLSARGQRARCALAAVLFSYKNDDDHAISSLIGHVAAYREAYVAASAQVAATFNVNAYMELLGNVTRAMTKVLVQCEERPVPKVSTIAEAFTQPSLPIPTAKPTSTKTSFADLFRR